MNVSTVSGTQFFPNHSGEHNCPNCGGQEFVHITNLKLATSMVHFGTCKRCLFRTGIMWCNDLDCYSHVDAQHLVRNLLIEADPMDDGNVFRWSDILKFLLSCPIGKNWVLLAGELATMYAQGDNFPVKRRKTGGAS